MEPENSNNTTQKVESTPIPNQPENLGTPSHPAPQNLPKKIAILILILILIAIGSSAFAYFLGKSQGTSSNTSLPTPTATEQSSNNDNQVACTMDAKQCPDGSYVSRQGSKCEFAECPTGNASSSANTTDWKTYSNPEFLFKYPSNLTLDGNKLSGQNPTITIYSVETGGTLMNECMKETSTVIKNGNYIKYFSRINNAAACKTEDISAREIWIMKNKESNPTISFQYSANEENKALLIFDQLLSTVKFN